MRNELRRWVDPRVTSVRVADVKSYLLRRHWAPLPAPRPYQLAFQEPQGGADGPAVLYVPSSEQFSDYPQRILEVVTELAEIEDRYAVDVLNDILRQASDGKPDGVSQDRPCDADVAGRS
jgi:hypothetical protein